MTERKFKYTMLRTTPYSKNHLRTATREYKCNHCDAPIEKGEKYFRWDWPKSDTVRSHLYHHTHKKYA